MLWNAQPMVALFLGPGLKEKMMKLNMKTLCFAMAMGFAGIAQATDINPDGPGGDPTINVGSLDWAPGSALVTPTTPGGSVTNPVVGDVYQTYALAGLNAFQNSNGVAIGGTGLNSTYEWTYIAAFQERVISVTGGGGTGTAVFNTVTGGTNFFRIYYDPTPDQNPVNGTGFGPDPTDLDSILILEGTILPFNAATQQGLTNFTASGVAAPPNPNALDQFGVNQYPNITSVTGTGGGSLTVLTTFANAAYFPQGVPSVFALIFDTQLNIPFTQTIPASCINNGGPAATSLIGAAGPNTAVGLECATNSIGTVNGITGPNDLLMTDSSTSFLPITVPEPGSLALVGLALAALGVTYRRRSV